MKGKKAQFSAVSVLTLILVLMASVVPAFAQDVEANAFAEKSIESTKIVWQPLVGYGGAVLTFVGPDDQAVSVEFGADRKPTLNNVDAQGNVLADGVYNYELMILRPDANTPPSDFDAEKRGVVDWEGTTEAVVESGTFSVSNGAFVTQGAPEGESGEGAAPANDINDILHLDDVIIDGSLCVGFDCVNGESFGFDTVRLKENNLRIKFDDTSSSASFPNNDWQITINDSANGGANKFSIDDISGGRTPFTIEASAPSHSLYVDDGGRLGLGTSTPVVDAHIKSGNTPTVRLEQDGSSGFAPQTWDVAGNEAGFFIRDATNGSTLPFRIRPSAPSEAIDIQGDGNVKFAVGIGIGTSSPAAQLEIEETGSNPKILVERTDGATFKLLAKTNAIEFGSNTNHGLKFIVNGTEVVTVDTNQDMTVVGDVTANGVLLTSDVNAKENFAAVDGQEVLARLAEVPIATWNFKSDEAAVRHIGPTAQDFAAAFGLGNDDTHISAVDADGVSLAAIQELYAQNLALQDKVDDLETRLAALETSDGAGSTAWPWQKTGFLPGASFGLVALGLVGLVWVSRRSD